jgi:hypothetical protein
MSEWIRVTPDNLPEYDCPVLGLIDGRPLQVVRRRAVWMEGRCYWELQLPDVVTFSCKRGTIPINVCWLDVSHWTPLPDDPEKGEP